MASVVVRVELTDQEMRDAILEKAKTLAGPNPGGGATVRFESIPDSNEFKTIVEFQRTGRS